MTKLQPWLIAFAGAVAATIGTALYFGIGIGGPLTIDQVPEFVTAHWRALPVPWISFYGVSILVLFGITALRSWRKVSHGWSTKEWAADIRYRLVAAQYFTCLTFLLAIGLAHFPFQDDSLPANSRLAEIILRFAPFAALGVAGLLISATVLFRTTPLTPPATGSPNLRMFEQDILRELERIAGLIERQPPPPLAEHTNGATPTALFEVVRAVHEDVKTLLARQALPLPTESSEAPVGLDRSASELQATVDLLQDLLRQLGEVSNSLVAADRLPRPAAERSELSQELKQLLQQMPPR